MLVIRLFDPHSKHFIVFSSVKEKLLEIRLHILLALTKSNALAGKIGYTLENFIVAVPIFLLLTLDPFLQLLINIIWLS